MHVLHVIRCTVGGVLFSLALLALPHQAQAQDSGAQGMPVWLQQAMNREASGLGASGVQLGEGFFTSKLAGAVAEPQVIEGGWYVLSDIGTAAPIECWIFTDTVDMATMTANAAEAVMHSTAERHGALGSQSIFFVDAGAYDAAPYLALEWLYTVGEAPSALVGLAKVRVAARDGVTLACGHNDAGYRETFAAAFEAFVRGATIRNDTPSPYYQEVLVQRIGGQSIGVSQSVFTLDGDGDSEILSFESALIPVDGTTLSVSDTWRSTYSRPDGTVINQGVATSNNGELTMQLSLDPTPEGSWLVSGTYHGKEIETQLDADATPLSELGQMKTVQALLEDAARSGADMPVWIPSADPTRFLTAAVELGNDGRGNLTIGPMTFDAQFDRSGSMRNGQISAGPANIEIDRVWANGTLP